MRKFADERLNDKDYMLIQIEYANGSCESCAVLRDGSLSYLLTNNPALNGTKISNLEQTGFRFSWAITTNSTNPLQVIQYIDVVDIEDLYIYASESHIDYYPNEFKSYLISNGYEGSRNTSLTTSQAIEFISRKYETTSIYAGQHCYHYHRGCYLNLPTKSFRGHRIGIELEVEFNSDSERQEFNRIESNWFYRESDGSLGSNGCEIITIPLLPNDAKSVEWWLPLTDYLANRARSWDTGRCGLHVHIGREILGKNEEQQSETIGKLLYLYHHFVKDTRLNHKVYGRERGYNDHDGKTDMGNAAKLLGSDVLKSKSVSDKVKQSMTRKSEEGRYFDINLKNTYTIEFRKGKGSINPNRIAMVVDYSERMCIYAKNTPWQQIGYADFVAFLKATNKNEDLQELIDDWS